MRLLLYSLASQGQKIYSKDIGNVTYVYRWTVLTSRSASTRGKQILWGSNGVYFPCTNSTCSTAASVTY